MKVCVITLGCKVNQYESDSIILALKNKQIEVFINPCYADFYVINTCAVTNEAEKKSRQMISKCLSYNPQAKVFVCGCASQHNSKQFLKSNEKNIAYIIGTTGKMKVVDEILSYQQEKENQFVPFELENNYSDEYTTVSTKTRSYLKIQDGCNNFCSYCLIPYVRGRSRSRSLESIYNEALKLQENTKEIVLTGINISDYRVDGQLALDQLVLKLKNIPVRFRFGSFEMNVLTDEFLKVMSENKNFCPHFHISLQSGSNSVLKRMNRKYTTEQFYKTITKIKQYFKNPSFTTDVIVGAVEETENEFNESYEFIKKVGFMDIHIFPYSRREGTVAARYNLVNGNVVKERIKKLEKLRKQLFLQYINEVKNNQYNLLIEEKVGEYCVGHTENYVKVYVKDNHFTINEIIPVKFLEVYSDGVIGEKC